MKNNLILVSLFSDEYETLYPFNVEKMNEGATYVFTKEEIDKMNVVTDIVSCLLQKYFYQVLHSIGLVICSDLI